MDDITAALDELWDWAAEHRLSVQTAHRDQLRRYLEILLRWNQGMALVSQHDAHTVVVKHFADSLMAAAAAGTDGAIADLGSGAGLPGMVIAIARPAASVTMVESRQRKVSFLLEAIRTAGVENARAIAERIEVIGADPAHMGRYSLVTARALANTEALLLWARPLLHPDGRMLAMKGPGYRDDLPSSARLRKLGFRDPEVDTYELPDGAERVLLDFCFT